MIYLDYNATTPLKPAVRESVVAAMDVCGNASSVHRYGQQARMLVEGAREEVAAMVGVKPAQVIFTSSGTEANNLALRATGRTKIVASAIEHDSILQGAATARLPVLASGVMDLDALPGLLEDGVSTVVSAMLVNNETGIVQPVNEIAAKAKSYGAIVHTDAVQAAGRMALDFAALGVDMMTLSAHKIGGPQGVGALIVRPDLPVAPLLHGGGQEMRRRAGTENVAGIAGFGEAARLVANDMINQLQLSEWRTWMENEIASFGEGVRIFGSEATRVANTSCIAMPGVSSEKQVVAFDLAGIAVSAGSACSSGKVKASHVLRAMGLDDNLAGCAIRVSSGWNTTRQDFEQFTKTWKALHARIRNMKQAA
ncbi:MAG: aminotransferase class V-fold PLP-dependent enzyme [Alphaproteobacteria bacterium]|nr:aminotransferase class V-fold PLP-dependent enzyme [Alphaproteobacteria bacterium]